MAYYTGKHVAIMDLAAAVHEIAPPLASFFKTAMASDQKAIMTYATTPDGSKVFFHRSTDGGCAIPRSRSANEAWPYTIRSGLRMENRFCIGSPTARGTVSLAGQLRCRF